MELTWISALEEFDVLLFTLEHFFVLLWIFKKVSPKLF
jgi:hypothetical protein